MFSWDIFGKGTKGYYVKLLRLLLYTKKGPKIGRNSIQITMSETYDNDGQILLFFDSCPIFSWLNILSDLTPRRTD